MKRIRFAKTRIKTDFFLYLSALNIYPCNLRLREANPFHPRSISIKFDYKKKPNF